jgi:hypothetical protein
MLVVALSMGACGPDVPPPTPHVPSPPLPTIGITSPIDGVVIEVDAASLSDVRGFTLRTRDGANLSFVLGVLENAAAFSPSHLAEHQVSSEPVRVYFRTENGGRIVYRLEDASDPSGS